VSVASAIQPGLESRGLYVWVGQLSVECSVSVAVGPGLSGHSTEGAGSLSVCSVSVAIGPAGSGAVGGDLPEPALSANLRHRPSN
jgi:hypothetical protein